MLCEASSASLSAKGLHLSRARHGSSQRSLSLQTSAVPAQHSDSPALYEARSAPATRKENERSSDFRHALNRLGKRLARRVVNTYQMVWYRQAGRVFYLPIKAVPAVPCHGHVTARVVWRHHISFCTFSKGRFHVACGHKGVSILPCVLPTYDQPCSTLRPVSSESSALRIMRSCPTSTMTSPSIA